MFMDDIPKIRVTPKNLIKCKGTLITVNRATEKCGKIVCFIASIKC